MYGVSLRKNRRFSDKTRRQPLDLSKMKHRDTEEQRKMNDNNRQGTRMSGLLSRSSFIKSIPGFKAFISVPLCLCVSKKRNPSVFSILNSKTFASGGLASAATTGLASYTTLSPSSSLPELRYHYAPNTDEMRNSPVLHPQFEQVTNHCFDYRILTA